MQITLSRDQRLLIETAASQRSSLVEIRSWTKLLDRIGFASDRERTEAQEAYILRIGQATLDAFEHPPMSHEEMIDGLPAYDLDDGDVDRIVRAVKSWNRYSPCDVQTAAAVLEMLGKPEPFPRRYPASFTLPASLEMRLQLLLFLKPQQGTLAEARKTGELARKFVLTRQEQSSIRYMVFAANGACQWDRRLLQAATGDQEVALTQTELDDLTERVKGHENWLPSDLQWLDPLLNLIEQPAAGKAVAAQKGSNGNA